jgi:hypothetical protein
MWNAVNRAEPIGNVTVDQEVGGSSPPSCTIQAIDIYRFHSHDLLGWTAKPAESNNRGTTRRSKLDALRANIATL